MQLEWIELIGIWFNLQVNDQIIEVDCQSLVGVTQAYAASVLRNTSGLVKFLIGRESDPHNSEVAQLIRQSVQVNLPALPWMLPNC